MNPTTLSKAQSEGNCSKCACNEKRFAKLKKAFIKADDENVRLCMKYENKISKFKAEKEWLEGKDSSGSQRKKKGVKRLSDQSNTTLRTPSPIKGEENEH